MNWFYKFSPLIYGIKPSWRLWNLIYFGHFIVIRVMIALLIGITPFSTSKSMLFALLVFQYLSLFTHILKIYSRWILYFYALIWELTLSFCVTYLLILQFWTSSTNFKEYIHFFWVYFGLQITYSLFGILNLFNKLFSFVIQRIKKRRQRMN